MTVALWGLIWGGPSQHYWQAFMHRVSPKTDMRTILLKVTADQLTFGPFNNLANIAFFTMLVEDKGFDHLKHKIWNEYPSIQMNGWKLWPAAAMFNYRFVPLNVRVLFLNLVALGWTTFLSVTASSQGPPPTLHFKDAQRPEYQHNSQCTLITSMFCDLTRPFCFL
eukprot:TRINITY_DN12918_c0_g1_i1.p2 TRINITY_DN12918_c0_g1~~TRINITY_DN12918_c0_g1_i1.p2  ORF type:complete len:189 (+),score=10.60 TRINITY_DN12918_c0_g1_i1:70-567(+)